MRNASGRKLHDAEHAWQFFWEHLPLQQLLSLAALRKLEATHGTKCHSRCTQIRSVPQLGASTRSGAIFYLLRVFEWKALPAGVVAELLQATAVAAPAYILRKLASLHLCVRCDSGC